MGCSGQVGRIWLCQGQTLSHQAMMKCYFLAAHQSQYSKVISRKECPGCLAASDKTLAVIQLRARGEAQHLLAQSLCV